MTRGSAILGGAAAAVAGGVVPRRVLAQAAPSISVLAPPNDGVKTVYYAVRSGIFRKYGLDVAITPIASGAAAAAAIIGGSADVAFTNIVTLIAANVKDVPMQMIAPGAISESDRTVSAIVVSKDSPIQTARDLDGKTIGSVSLGDILSTATLAWIDRNGGDSRAVKVIEVPLAADMQALDDGRISAAVMNEPFVSQAVASGKARILANPYTAVAKSFIAALYAVMGPAADKNADAMRRFAQAMHEASVYVNSHLAETVDLVASYTGLAPDVVAHSSRYRDADFADPALVQPVIDVLAKYGVIAHPIPAQRLISPYALTQR